MYALFDVINFLVSILLSVFAYIVIVRILLGMTRADFYNPISQFVLTATNPFLMPLRKVLPSIGKVDTAAVVLVLILKFAELSANKLLLGKAFVIGPLISATLLAVINAVLNVFIFSIFVLVIISWVAPHVHSQNNPMASILRSITEPLLRPARKLIPRIGVFDLSTFVVLLILLSIKRLLFNINYLAF